MKKQNQILTISILLLILVLAMASINNSQPIACTEEAKLCPGGSAVVRNSSLNCEFNSCPTEEKFPCNSESRDVELCIEIYQPVCGWFNPEKVQCITFPCAVTLSNSCFACQDEQILHYTEGECPKPS
jgi:hypothetical protein